MKQVLDIRLHTYPSAKSKKSLDTKGNFVFANCTLIIEQPAFGKKLNIDAFKKGKKAYSQSFYRSFKEFTSYLHVSGQAIGGLKDIL